MMLAVTLVAVIAGLASFFVQRSAPKPSGKSARRGAAAAEFAGSAACAGCHPSEFASHSRSGHARTLRRAEQTVAARRLAGHSFDDPEIAGASFHYELTNGQFSTERRAGGATERFLIDYAFGSGTHATTFVTLTDRSPQSPAMLEHRLTVYSNKDSPDITAGQGEVRGPNRPGVELIGRRFPAAATLKCFECHVTAMSDRGPTFLDEATMIPNVGCESCHGPARAHIAAAHAGAKPAALTLPFGPDRSSPGDELRLCGRCHRLPETIGRDLIRPENPTLVRFQPVGLMQSACYRQSEGKLTCSTCHNPHTRPSTDVREYESICLSCHQPPGQTSCPVSPATGCIGCHMPRRDATRGMMLSDHWIRARPESRSGPGSPVNGARVKD
jgi:hypothetical protein